MKKVLIALLILSSDSCIHEDVDDFTCVFTEIYLTTRDTAALTPPPCSGVVSHPTGVFTAESYDTTIVAATIDRPPEVIIAARGEGRSSVVVELEVGEETIGHFMYDVVVDR